MSSREQLTIATLNTRGTPLRGSQLADRYRAIGAYFDGSETAVVTFQEVHTYYHLRLLRTAMPSYAVSFQPSLAGPAGGVVTFVRRPAATRSYRRLPTGPGVPRWPRTKAHFKGVLLTRFDQVWIANTHLLANLDGDWSDASRFTPIHRAQLNALARVIASLEGPIVLCGDFNVARESTPYKEFLDRTGLVDAFGGECPPTFHAEYLGPGKSPHCIDFILTRGLEILTAEQILTDKLDLPQGPAYVSDHVGLCATTSAEGRQLE
ncbi:endonuclease/exonuclease/phosphatase family protein [Kribbella italica]|uniref:Endonuclease/exonuclease/phosphatase family metal-dependent hydrolase n=1 Tax=Kribbella italica TaxID=1540520 RepID=A0A7W9J937_9ACTN|nr:endonuclease/exonuclease/phosphatase family protein [Kribbella italica]MBB5837178.1 endonuclease/exonuclease/phosphatase family metal-dependent hydrolase [Kribbella italica]